MLGRLLALLALALFTVGVATAGTDAKPRPKCLGKPATIVGTAKADVIFGTGKADVIVGLAGDDRVVGAGGADLLCGGAGADVLFGGGGSDRADGGAGTDACRTSERRTSCEESRPAPSAATNRTVALTAGEYVTDWFRPRLVFAVGQGWSVVNGDRTTALQLARRTEPGGMVLHIDSARATGGPPETQLARLLDDPNVQATSPAPTSIAGGTGIQVDVTVGPETATIGGLAERYELAPTDRARFVVITVAGATITMIVEAPVADFAAFSPLADEVISTLRFG